MALVAWLVPYLLLNMVVLSAPLPILGEATFKVGASADDGSRHNFGVKVDIQTHAYNTSNNTLQYFWVGDDLSNGAFIQFGYSLEPGVNCLRGEITADTFSCTQNSEPIPPSDARWQWQYWPDSSKPDFYFEIGPPESAGLNASIQEYEILPSVIGTWTFIADGRVVSETDFPVNPSTGPALIVAEGSATNESQQLGPVEYIDLSYFDGATWKMADSLIAISSCGISVACAAGHYGVASVNSDTIIVGSGTPRMPDGTILWTSAEERLVVQVHSGLQFFVTTPMGAETYDGNTTLSVPKGMFAYVSLPNAETDSTGILGWLGGEDHFVGWTGALSSTNFTIQILMNSDKTITASWTTDETVPITVSVLTIGIIFAVACLVNRRRKREGQTPRRV